MDTTLTARIAAAGLAVFANNKNSSKLMAIVRRQYLISLRNINTALNSSEDVITDSTLTSIMVVGIFESVTGYTPSRHGPKQSSKPKQFTHISHSTLMAPQPTSSFEVDSRPTLSLDSACLFMSLPTL